MRFEAQGYGQGEFTWSGARPASYLVVASRHGLELWRGSADAGADGRLSFVVPVPAVEPMTVEVRCGGAREP
jgi:hypothetical protein